MKTYEVELDDGRVFEVDALEPPSHEDVLSQLGMGQEQSPMVDTGQGTVSSMLGEAGRSVLSIPKGMVGGAGDILSLFPGMQDNFLQDSADEIEKWYKGMIPVNPTLEKSFPVKASGAAGQGLGFLGTTLATTGLGATPAIARSVGLGTAGLMGADQGGDTADQYGMADWTDRAASILGGAAIETGTEMMGGFGSKNFTESLLGAMKSAARPGTILTRGAKTVLGEGAEEVAAGQLQDWLTSGLVDKDPERPGFALNGSALPPDTLSMQNLYNRLEEGALGAVGGAVFAGAEALGSRTPVDEALSLRMQAKTLLNDLQAKETLTPEEQTQLAQVQAEDANVSAWLERQGFEAVRPALEQIIQNPDVEDSERVQAVEYASLIDNLSATEADAEASPEEIEQARSAVDTHPLNGLNPLARTRQNNAITGTFEEKQKALSEEVDAYQKRQNLSRELQSGAPVDPVEVQDVVVSDMQEQTKETAQQVAPMAPATAQALEQIANESQDATTPTVQELAPVQEPSAETSPQALSRPPPNTQPKLRKPKVRLGLSISPREVQRAVKKFEKISGVRVASVEELARDPQFRAGWERTAKDPSPEAWDKFVNEQLSTAEGLANDGRGQAVIIPENLAIYNTDQTRAKRNKTTAGEEAMLRVLSHENWHGVERWLDRDPSPEAKELQQRYHGLLNEISDAELDDMAQRRYTNLSDWRNDAMTKRLLQSEVMAERRETAELTGEPDSLIEKFLAWLRDVFKAVTQSTENPTPDELQELFEAWYRAQKTPTTGPPQASQPEQYNYPTRPEVVVAFRDWIPSVNQEQALQLAWESFYRDQVNQGVDPDQIAEAWAEEAADPDSYFVAQGMTDAFMESRKRPTETYTPSPSQATPETGPKHGKRKSKTPEPTAEDIARRFPQFSQPEMTPEQRVEAMEARAQFMSYETQAGQQEGLDPTKATSDQRQFKDGTPVDFSRASTTRAGQQAQGRDDIQALTQLSPDGPSETFGKDLMDFLSGKTPTIFGYRGNEFSKLNMLNYLDSAVQDRAQMGIDGGEVQKIRSQYLSKAGAALQTAANSIYKPLQEIANKATEITDTEAKKDLGTDDFKGLADTAKYERKKQVQEAAKDLVPTLPLIAEAAQNDADSAVDFEAAISSLPPNEQKAVRDLLNELEELDELLRMEAELSAGQSGPAASRAEVRSQRLTLEEVRARIAQKRKNITKLVEEIQKAKVDGDPVEAAKKVVKKVRKAKQAKVTDNASFHDYVDGKETAGVESLDKLMQKYVQGNAFNRDALRTELTNSFKSADPNFINGVAARIGDYLDGVATEEGIAEDAKKAVNYDARAKRLLVANIARQSTEETEESTAPDPLVELAARRLRGEVSVADFQKGLMDLGIEEQTAFAYSQKSDQDRARIGDAKAQRELNAQAKKDMAAFKRGSEQHARKTEATIAQLAKEFSDTLSTNKAKDIDAYKALLNNYIGVNGPPISEEVFIEEAKRLNIPESGYTRLMGVLNMQRKRAAVVLDAKARIKQEADDKKEIEAFDRNAEATISRLSKEFSDTHAWAKPSDITEYKALLNNYLGVNGPPISEAEFLEGAKRMRMSESASTRLLGVLNMQRSRAAAVQDAKSRQKAADKAAAEAKKEDEKSTKEAEATISSLAKEFSDTLPSKDKTKEASELQRLISDYTGKNGPIISEEAFERRATALKIPEGVLERLRGVLQMQRKRESMTADAKFRQKEAERLQREKDKFEREALSDISKFATAFSDTLSDKANKDASDLKVLSDSFLGKSGPPITEEQFLERATALNLKEVTAQKLLKLFSESRRRDAAVRYAKALQKAQEAKERAVEALVKKLDKVKNPTPQKLKKRSTFVNSIMGAMETGILDSEAVRAAFAEAYELHGLTNERLKSMGDLLQKIEAMREGMVKETFLNRFNQILNEIAPTASFVTHAHSALMGYVLSGITTMGMQLTGINRYINPLAGTVEILWGAPGTTSQKVGRTINPANFFRLYLQGIREVGENFQQGLAGLSGVKTSAGKGLGASPSTLASVTPRQTSLSYTPWGQISQYRFNTPKLLKAMGLDKMVSASRYPAWMVSRSFQVIRAAEGIVGGADKNMQWRAQMTYALMQESPSLSFAEAYSRVSDALGDKTAEMWQDAYKQADSEIAKGLVAKSSRKQRATELAQDALEDKWQKNLGNRSRELSALAGYKQDPITPLGAWVYKGVSSVLNKDKGAAQYLKFSFLFARFFSNALETAYSRTPLGGLSALMIDTTKPEGRMDEREKRIVQMFGSMQGYKDARMGRAISGTAVMGGLAGLMIMALKGWDPDDDEAPFFWITGDPLGEFSKKGSMEAGGWYKSNTLYIGPLRINYVNASPEYAMSMAAVGSIADRFMFDKLLNYRENKETGEYEHSGYEAYGKPVLEALAAPVSRSTFRQWYDMLEAAYDGNFTKITKALSNPVTGTAIALSPLALVPSIKTAEKYDRANEQPRSPQNPAQAAMGSVPFADELGLDAGKPLTTPFGNPLTPFPFWSIFSNSQEVPPEVSKAARTLTDLGVSRLGPREEYFGWGMAEIANDGKRYLLNDEERSKVLQDIGSRFARKVNAESAKLRKIEAGAEGRKKVRSAITDLAAKARSEALMNYRPQKK